MMRLSRSRPRLSVPSGYSQLPPSFQAGGILLADSVCSMGSCGASTGANTAVSTINRNRLTPTRPAVSRLSSRNRVRSRPCAGAAFTGVCVSGGTAPGGVRVDSLIANPWVDQAVDDVGQDGESDNDQAGEEGNGLHQRKITDGDGVDGHAAQA